MSGQTIGERIKTRRILRNLSIRQAAGLAGIDPSTLSRIEAGKRSADNRHTLAAIAGALQCPTSDLTGLPRVPTDRASARIEASVHSTVQALLDTDLDLPATLSRPRPLGALAEEARHVQDLGLSCRYATAVDHLPALLREAHAYVRGPDRAEALRTLGVAARWSMVALKCLGHTGEAWVAAERSHDAAVALGDPIVLGIAAWSKGHAATSCGAYARAVAVAIAGIEALRDCREPGAETVRGSLHLLAGWSEWALGRKAEGDALIAAAGRMARETGETGPSGSDPYGLAFGPTNVGLWQISAATEAGDSERVVDLARGLSPGALPVSRQAAFYVDVGRALAGDQDAQAIRMLLQAERLGPERVRRSPLVAETVRAMVDRTRRSDQPALSGLAERLNLG
jgi:transcriptional regulator with XRE-family HTH domain